MSNGGSGWKMIGYIGVVLGIALLVIAVFAYYYAENLGGFYGFDIPWYPYRDYAFPLGVAGVLSLIVGAISLTYKRQRVQVQPV